LISIVSQIKPEGDKTEKNFCVFSMDDRLNRAITWKKEEGNLIIELIFYKIFIHVSLSIQLNGGMILENMPTFCPDTFISPHK
jgi:hypothetical protein